MSPDSPQFGRMSTTSEGSLLIEFSDAGTDTTPRGPDLVTAESLLEFMRSRVRYYGSPLPDGFVPPPGIDLEALLKRVPWPEPPSE